MQEIKKPCKYCTPYCPEHYTGAMREPRTCPECGRHSYLLGLEPYPYLDHGYKNNSNQSLDEEYFQKILKENKELLKEIKDLEAALMNRNCSFDFIGFAQTRVFQLNVYHKLNMILLALKK